MASKDKEILNFFKIAVFVVHHIKHAFVNMLTDYLLQNNMSFIDFIGKHMIHIRYLKRTNVLSKDEVGKLIIGDVVISDIQEKDLEGMLVRCLLVNLCPELFMDGCKTLQDFLKKNQHDIYHLFKFNEPCCQCSQDYTFPVESQLLEKYQYEKMFKSSPCTNCTATSETVCSVSTCIVTDDIRFDYTIRCHIFGHFSPLFKAMQKLTYLRIHSFAHIAKIEMENHIYDGFKKDIEENIMVLARFCGKEDETQLALDDVQKLVIGKIGQDMQLQEVTEQMRKMNLNKGFVDGVVLHAEDDRDEAIEFIQNMERENPDLDIDMTIYENLFPGKSLLALATELFDSCRFLFVFVTPNFDIAPLQQFYAQISTIETLIDQEKQNRLIPVLTDKTCNVSWLRPIQPLRYDIYLEANKSEQGPDQTFIKCFKKLITDGRPKYLVN